MGLQSDEQLLDRPVRHPGHSADIRPGETPSQWAERMKEAADA